MVNPLSFVAWRMRSSANGGVEGFWSSVDIEGEPFSLTWSAGVEQALRVLLARQAKCSQPGGHGESVLERCSGKPHGLGLDRKEVIGDFDIGGTAPKKRVDRPDVGVVFVVDLIGNPEGIPVGVEHLPNALVETTRRPSPRVG